MIDTVRALDEKGVLLTLLALGDGKKSISDLRKTKKNKNGVGSRNLVTKSLQTLMDLGFVEMEEGESPSTKSIYCISQKGDRFLKLLNAFV